MPPAGLGDEDVWRVVAYIRSLRARAADFPTEGDRERGAALFWGKAECGRCHMVHGRGGLLGPDLSDLAQRLSLRALREALTVPKPLPPKGYEPASITTNQGERIRGVLKNRHNFSYQLLSEDGRLHLLSADEVARVDIADSSLMPADYERRLSIVEFRDLLAYLTRLVR
jgi:putative heme-binding domain-containing protein